MLQDFTGDRERLESIIETLIVGEDQNSRDTADDASSADTGAAFGQDDAEFNIFNTDRQLSALQTAARMLGTLNEKKSLIYFASGLRLNGIDNQAQLHATINAAIRAGVSFWPDRCARPGGAGAAGRRDARLARRHRDVHGAGRHGGARQLPAIAGHAVHAGRGHRRQGAARLQRPGAGHRAGAAGHFAATTSSATTPATRRWTASSGASRSRCNTALYARASITARATSPAKQFGKFTTADKERQLEDALMLGDPVTELTIAMEVNYFQLNRAEYFVPVVREDSRQRAGAGQARRRRAHADRFHRRSQGRLRHHDPNVRDKVDIKLSDETAAELAKRPIQYDTGFTLLPGKYVIKFLARDAETGRIGTYRDAVRDSEPEQGRQADSDQLGGAEQPARGLRGRAVQRGQGQRHRRERVNPLVQDGQKLIPSVTRVFSKSRDMYVYLQAYEHEAPSAQPLVAFVTFYRGRRRRSRRRRCR